MVFILILKQFRMSDKNFEIRVLLKHYWKQEFSARAAAAKICEVEGEGTVTHATAAKWFQRFTNGETDLSDKLRSGRPAVLENEALLEARQQIPGSSSRELAADLGVSHPTVLSHLHELGAVQNRPRQIPYELSPQQIQQRLNICNQLLAKSQDRRLWERIVTQDEKWVYLRNPNMRKRWRLPDEPQETEVRRQRYEKKMMISVWWNFEGVLHFEIIPDGKSVNATLYATQLQKVHDILAQRYPALINRKGVVLQRDNARSHTGKIAAQKIKELADIEVLPHPACSPDLAPSDYYLFRAMAHFLRGRRFETEDDLENGCREFFASKNPEWYRHGIEELAERWQKVIDNNGLYFEE